MKLKAAQRDSADQVWQAASALLDSGAQGANLLFLAEVDRAVHSTRVSRLHRLAAAGTRVAQQLRDLHAARPEFRLGALTADMHQLLLVANTIRTASGEVDARWIGEARRGYTEIGDLRLWGLFTEAVASSSGYAGAVTYCVAEDASLWSVGDVAPGEVSRCRWAYVTPFDLGEVSLTHRALGRDGLRLEHATASENRRLGSGRRVTAEVADGLRWSEAHLANLWAPSLRSQLDRAWSARTEDVRRAGDDLLFLRCRVLGTLRDALVLNAGGGLALRGVAPSAHAELAYRQNLALLSGANGLDVWLVGRVAFARPRTVELLAAGGDGLALPEDWCGRVNLGLDRLQAVHVPEGAAARPVVDVDAAPTDPLLPLARRLEQLLLGGRTTASSAVSGFVRDEALLAKNQLPTAAALLRRLREDPSAEAWLAARVYLTAAQARLQKDDWLGGA